MVLESLVKMAFFFDCLLEKLNCALLFAGKLRFDLKCSSSSCQSFDEQNCSSLFGLIQLLRIGVWRRVYKATVAAYVI
jgi:hypothetical protein